MLFEYSPRDVIGFVEEHVIKVQEEEQLFEDAEMEQLVNDHLKPIHKKLSALNWDTEPQLPQARSFYNSVTDL